MTGDIHSGWACELPYDPATYPLGDSAGVEFVCSSVTSNNLKDITGAPPRTASLAGRGGDPGQQPAHQVPRTSTTTASRSSTSPASAPRWTGSSSATAPTGTPRSPGRGRWPPRPAPAGCTRSDRCARAARDGARSSRRPGGDRRRAPHGPHRRRRRRAALDRAAGVRRGHAGRGKPQATPRRRAYVLVVDGCRPDEIDEGLTPNLQALRDGGLRFPRASSMPVMETIPNHVMMMTGVRPDRVRRPGQLDLRPRPRRGARHGPAERHQGPHRHRAAQPAPGYRTGTVLSKEYLYGVFGEPGHRTAGSRRRSSRSPGTRPTSSRWRPRWRCSTRSTRT